MTKQTIAKAIGVTEGEIAARTAAARAKQDEKAALVKHAADVRTTAAQKRASRQDLLRRSSAGDLAAKAALVGLADEVDALELQASDLDAQAAACDAGIRVANAAVAEPIQHLARLRCEANAAVLHESTDALEKSIEAVQANGDRWAQNLTAYQQAHANAYGVRATLHGVGDSEPRFLLARNLAARLKTIVPDQIGAVHGRWDPELGSFKALVAPIKHGRSESTT